jgi:ABC-2 type transport system ATP-binding protein
MGVKKMVIRSKGEEKIEVINVSKNFGQVKALDNISLTFEKEHIYGLLGRNGAGKTTLLNIICNRLFADSGEVLIDGEQSCENDRVQSHLYYMSEKNCYPETMTVRDAFRWSDRFYPGFDNELAMKLCDKFELNPKKKMKQLSTGYNSIFKAIVALCVDIPYILLDEPVLGLDASHRQMLYQAIIESYALKPRTFVISTHLIEEITTLLETVMIIKKGSLVTVDSTENLLKAGYAVTGKSASVDAYTTNKQIIGEDVLGGLKTAYIMGQLDRSSIPNDLDINRMDLQKLFIRMTEDSKGGINDEN